jgi:hypothetical protein
MSRNNRTMVYKQHAGYETRTGSLNDRIRLYVKPVVKQIHSLILCDLEMVE